MVKKTYKRHCISESLASVAKVVDLIAVICILFNNKISLIKGKVESLKSFEEDVGKKT